LANQHPRKAADVDRLNTTDTLPSHS